MVKLSHFGCIAINLKYFGLSRRLHSSGLSQAQKDIKDMFPISGIVPGCSEYFNGAILPLDFNCTVLLDAHGHEDEDDGAIGTITYSEDLKASFLLHISATPVQEPDEPKYISLYRYNKGFGKKAQ